MRAVLLVLVMLTGSAAAATPVTVFLERGGHREQTDDGIVQIPRFGGSTRVWNAVVGCVQEKFSAFQVDIVDQRPHDGDFITAVVGGSADQLGFDPDHVAGVGPENGEVIPDAVVHIFSRTIGERDTQQLCETTAHEIGHALGLDHSMQCGDLMSYPREECGDRPTLTFTNVDAACGEYSERECTTGDTQNSFQRLAALVGLRGEAPTEETSDSSQPEESPPEVNANPDPWASSFEPEQSTPAPQPTQVTESCSGHRHRRHAHRRRMNASWN